MPPFRRKTPRLSGIPLHLSELDEGELKDLRGQFRASATNQSRPDGWRQIFYHLVELIDEERLRRSTTHEPEIDPLLDGEKSSSLSRFLLKLTDDN